MKEAAMASSTVALPRVYAERGLLSWLTTVDHKRIGILYILGAGFFALIGGLEALLIRTQLAIPNNRVLVGEAYNQVLTMHGTTMVFLVVMPVLAGLGNYVVPLMIGARDMAYPRLNAFGVWMFLLGGIFLNLSFLLGGAPDAGMVRLRAADGENLLQRRRHRLLDPGPAAVGDLLHHLLHQLCLYHPAVAGARSHPEPAAAFRLDHAGDRLPHSLCDAQHLGGPVPPVPGPPSGDPFLQPGSGW
jgi:hypothetical protein